MRSVNTFGESSVVPGLYLDQESKTSLSGSENNR